MRDVIGHLLVLGEKKNIYPTCDGQVISRKVQASDKATTTTYLVQRWATALMIRTLKSTKESENLRIGRGNQRKKRRKARGVNEEKKKRMIHPRNQEGPMIVLHMTDIKRRKENVIDVKMMRIIYY